MSKKHDICIAYGDGIGPEIMQATLDVLDALDVQINTHEIEIGEKVFNKGITSGISEKSWELINKYPVFLKAPITTPQGKGYKSLNVTLRKTLGLYANIRRSLSYAPVIPNRFPNMDVVIFRENEEDLYAGIEHRQTQEVYQCLKLTSRPGSEKIIRAAFDYAKSQGRKKISCLSKDNIMKLTDGVFHQIFDEIKKEYPEIETDHHIIDIGAARLANNPENFDVVVCQNLYGDILSDISAEISGSVGLAGSSNIGEKYAMFEAIHGSAPDIAGQGKANPMGLMFGAVEMLNYLGEAQKAKKMHQAILVTLEEKMMTGDLAKLTEGVKALSTQEFTKNVINNLGKSPKQLDHAESSNKIDYQKYKKTYQKEDKKLLGIDIFVDEDNRNPNILAETLIHAAEKTNLELSMITNRGVKVWPNYNPATFCTDHWRCRFEAKKNIDLKHSDLVSLFSELEKENIDFIKSEGLFSFNGKAGFSLGQGQ